MQPGLQRIIWLASFPKSGNTWMRTFLATYFLGDNRNIDINSLREFTLSDARHDFFMRATGGTHPADADVPTYMRARVKALRLIAGAREGTHFVKTHQILDQVDGIPLIPPELTAAAIYIMRNPFDIVPSFARHTSASIDDTIAQMTNPANILGSTSGTYDILGRWDDHVASWTQAPGLPLAVVRYEDLLTNPRNGFQPVFDFLKVRPEPAKLKKTIRATSFASLRKQEDEKGFVERPAGMEKFFHSGRAGGWRDVLTDAQVGVLHREFRPALEKWYPELVAETEQIAGRAGA
jgi:hypothetical protein